MYIYNIYIYNIYIYINLKPFKYVLDKQKNSFKNTFIE